MEEQKQKHFNIRIGTHADTRPLSPLYLIGLQEQIDGFFQDLSILLSSGMDMVTAVKAMQKQMVSRRMKKILGMLLSHLEEGMSLTAALQSLKIAQPFVLSLVETGEASGRLPENLKVAVLQQKRLHEFFSSVRQAMIYPAIVLSLTVVVGLGTSWFVLPKLTSTFTGLQVELPAITRGLVALGTFVSDYGAQVIPVFIIVFFFTIYFLFGFRKTRHIGFYLLFLFPITRKILRDSEIARFGFLLGVLLEAGLPITTALATINQSTTLRPYKRLYQFMHQSIDTGDSFGHMFDSYARASSLVPITAQYMIMAGERGGSLPQALQNIGDVYEQKTSTHLKTIATILEPVVIIIVGLGVVTVALSILLPIYSIVGNIR